MLVVGGSWKYSLFLKKLLKTYCTGLKGHTADVSQVVPYPSCEHFSLWPSFGEIIVALCGLLKSSIPGTSYSLLLFFMKRVAAACFLDPVNTDVRYYLRHTHYTNSDLRHFLHIKAWLLNSTVNPGHVPYLTYYYCEYYNRREWKERRQFFIMSLLAAWWMSQSVVVVRARDFFFNIATLHSGDPFISPLPLNLCFSKLILWIPSLSPSLSHLSFWAVFHATVSKRSVNLWTIHSFFPK